MFTVRLGTVGLISDGYWVEDHERDLIRVQSLSLRTTKDQGSLTTREGQKRWRRRDESKGVENDSNYMSSRLGF